MLLGRSLRRMFGGESGDQRARFDGEDLRVMAQPRRR
jgi:hypothetical protein